MSTYPIQPTEHVAADGRIWGRDRAGIYCREAGVAPPPAAPPRAPLSKSWIMPTDRRPMSTGVEYVPRDAPAPVLPVNTNPWQETRVGRRPGWARLCPIQGFAYRAVTFVPDDGYSVHLVIDRVRGFEATVTGQVGTAVRGPRDGSFFITAAGEIRLVADRCIELRQKARTYPGLNLPGFGKRARKNVAPAGLFQGRVSATRLTVTECQICGRRYRPAPKGPMPKYCGGRCRQRANRSRQQRKAA
jgi:hypothetical protein